MSTPAQRREKILRDFAMAMSNLDAGLFGIAANAKEAIAAADAIPDAPVVNHECCECGNCGYCRELARGDTEPVPSRAKLTDERRKELIELMCETWLNAWGGLSELNRKWHRGEAARVLDALIKVKAVRDAK